MDVELKIQILLCLLLVVVLIVCFMVIINSIGSIGHIYNRLEEIVTKETILRFQNLQEEVETEKKVKADQMDKERRSRALQDVELDMENPEESPDSEKPA